MNEICNSNQRKRQLSNRIQRVCTRNTNTTAINYCLELNPKQIFDAASLSRLAESCLAGSLLAIVSFDVTVQ
jgi:hypothetical protein